ncbi:N-acetyltransferase [Parabacteroides sp. GYB001]|uniref:acyltransferase n=1 Tax=Parabacteroides leei TaxID=2939491 RepID=UPI0020174B13|nr:acyltransferase [Parabacteroides leei]MCL3853394.1 N-acetyltransferase [Parabacteroides leei]
MPKIHPLADVQSTKIGKNTTIWQFCVILPKARIGEDCNICTQVFIENDVCIGDRVTIKSGVQVWDGVVIEDNVFIGPNVTFTNDLLPRSRSKDWILVHTKICMGASIGANSTIVGGITIGNYALVGAGSVVTKDIPPYTVWYGNPARLKGYITQDGVLLDINKKDKSGKLYNI